MIYYKNLGVTVSHHTSLSFETKISPYHQYCFILIRGHFEASISIAICSIIIFSQSLQVISTKFPGFLINLDFDEQKKLYKLISQTNDIGNAKKVCDFLKKIKTSCLFKKQ